MLITKILGPVNVLVQKSSRAKGQVIHIDKLKRCQGDTPRSWLTAGPATEGVAAVEPLAEATAEAPLSVPENDEMQTEEVAAEEVAPGAKPLGRDERAQRTNPAATMAPPTLRVQPRRNAGTPRRYLQRGRVEDQCEGTVVLMHSLRCY